MHINVGGGGNTRVTQHLLNQFHITSLAMEYRPGRVPEDIELDKVERDNGLFLRLSHSGQAPRANSANVPRSGLAFSGLLLGALTRSMISSEAINASFLVLQWSGRASRF